MGMVAITIHGRSYRLSCDDGQEDRLHRLAREVDKRTRMLAQNMGMVEEAVLLVLTMITMADEICDLQDALNTHAETREESSANTAATTPQLETAVADALNQLAARVERIAGWVENG